MPCRLLRSLALLALTLAVLSPIAFAQADPVTVFRQAIDARNRGDLAGVMALFADNAVRQDGGCQPSCTGEAAIRRSVEANIAGHHQATVLATQAAGNTVTARAELWSDAFRAGGAERVITDFTIEVLNGKIVGWSSTQDENDAQTAAYQAAQRAQRAQTGPGSAQLPPTGESGVTPALALALAAGALAASLGLGLRRRAAAATTEKIE